MVHQSLHDFQLLSCRLPDTVRVAEKTGRLTSRNAAIWAAELRKRLVHRRASANLAERRGVMV